MSERAFFQLHRMFSFSPENGNTGICVHCFSERKWKLSVETHALYRMMNNRDFTGIANSTKNEVMYLTNNWSAFQSRSIESFLSISTK